MFRRYGAEALDPAEHVESAKTRPPSIKHSPPTVETATRLQCSCPFTHNLYPARLNTASERGDVCQSQDKSSNSTTSYRQSALMKAPMVGDSVDGSLYEMPAAPQVSLSSKISGWHKRLPTDIRPFLVQDFCSDGFQEKSTYYVGTTPADSTLPKHQLGTNYNFVDTESSLDPEDLALDVHEQDIRPSWTGETDSPYPFKSIESANTSFEDDMSAVADMEAENLSLLSESDLFAETSHGQRNFVHHNRSTSAPAEICTTGKVQNRKLNRQLFKAPIKNFIRKQREIRSVTSAPSVETARTSDMPNSHHDDICRAQNTDESHHSTNNEAWNVQERNFIEKIQTPFASFDAIQSADVRNDGVANPWPLLDEPDLHWSDELLLAHDTDNSTGGSLLGSDASDKINLKRRILQKTSPAADICQQAYSAARRHAYSETPEWPNRHKRNHVMPCHRRNASEPLSRSFAGSITKIGVQARRKQHPGRRITLPQTPEVMARNAARRARYRAGLNEEQRRRYDASFPGMINPS